MRFPAPFARSRAILLKTVMLAVVLALAVPVAASASPLSNLDVTLLLQPQGGLEPLLLVAGRLPDGTQLPAEIALPVPAGSAEGVVWAGEIFGGPVENDPAVTPRFEERDGTTVAVLELTQSLIGQIEIDYSAGTSIVADDLRTGGFDLAAAGEIGSARLAVAVPPGFQAASLPEGVLTAEVDGGLVYYYVERTGVAPGDPLAFEIEYRGSALPAGAVPASQGQAGEVPIFLVVLVAVVLAGAVLIVLATRSKQGVQGEVADEALESEDYQQESFAADEPQEAQNMEVGLDPSSAPEAPVATGGSQFLTPKILLIGAAVLVIALFVILNLGGESGQVGVTEQSGNLVSQRISTASAESEASYPLQIPCSCPPEEEALKMFDALRQVPGVAFAALDTATLVMNIQYDPALVEASSIEERLRAAGYLN